MKHTRKYALALCAALLLIAPAALAAELSASAAPAAVQVGDQVQVSVTLSGKELAVAQGVFTYDSALLSFVEGDGGAADGNLAMVSAEKGGSSSLTARITFEAVGAGTANIEFTIENVLNYDGDKQDAAKATASVSIAEAPVVKASEEPAIDYSQTGVKAVNVQGAAADMYVWRSLENVTIPSQYAETDIQYHGESVKGAAVADSDAPTLLYLSEATGENAGYYVYLAAQDQLYRYTTLSGTSRTYILLQPDGSIQTPEGFTQTTLTVDEKEIAAWQAEDAQGTVYLVYARSPEGETGFYTYSVEDKSLQRYAVLPARPVVVELTPSPAPLTTPAPEPVAEPAAAPADGVTLSTVQFWALCGGAALLLVLLITTLISHSVEKKRRRRRALERRAAREREAAQQGME